MLGIIQAHAISWDGGIDKSLRKVEGRYCIEHTIATMKQVPGIHRVSISTTELEEDDVYEGIAQKAGISIFRGHVHNVLERLSSTLAEAGNAEIGVFSVAMHPFFNSALAGDMLTTLLEENLDLVHPSILFPAPFGSTVFRKRALEQARDILDKMEQQGLDVRLFKAKPLTFIMEHPTYFKIKSYSELPHYEDRELLRLRERAKAIYTEEAPEYSSEKAYSPASNLEERYRFSLPFLPADAAVLDIACGTGFGSSLIAQHCRLVTGGDIDEKLLAYASDKYKTLSNVTFQYTDAQNLPFEDNQFDAVLSMGTIEHMSDVNRYVSEMKRVLKPGGLFICSTPQSTPPYGRIPYLPWHVQEFSASEFRNIVGAFFQVEKIYGIVNGVFRDQEEGNGMIGIFRTQRYKA